MLKRFNIYKIMLNRKEGISKRVNNKTFTNSSKSKMLKYSLSIKNENMIRHHSTFKNLYSSLWELIIAIDFDVLVDFIKHSIRCIIFSRVSKREMHFASIDKNENVKLHEIAMVSSMIYDLSFMTIRTWKMSREITVQMKRIKIFRSWMIAVKL